MKRILLVLLALACTPLAAQDVGPGEVLRIATRDGVSVPLYAYWQDSAQATIVLFSGGAGGYGKIADDGWPASGNFLIRTGKRWAGHAFNIIMVGRPSDGIDLALGGVRAGEAHAADNRTIFKALKRKSPAPLWVVGTSMGTISASAAAIADSENLIAGVVLTSSIVARKIPGAVPTQALDKIRVPVLVLHHENDACTLCRPDEARSIAGELTNAPVSKTIFVSGGSGARGNPCEAFHYHGFIGMENDAVDLIAAWILKPAN